MKRAHAVAEAIGIGFDSHTLKTGVVEFIKLKRPVARYDVVTGEMRVFKQGKGAEKDDRGNR